jgi:ACS family glucarate transporter-like MFS transporter
MPAMKRPPVRVVIVLALTAMAVLLYLERVCVSVAEGYIRWDLGLDKLRMDAAFGAFFIAYALGQVPGGYLAQKYGPRLILTLSMAGWSVFGIFIALAQDFPTLFAARFLLGLSQASAYPAAAVLLKRWIPDRHRGIANGVVAFGGRFGGAAATGLTGFLIIAFVPLSTPATVTESDFTNGTGPSNSRVDFSNHFITGGDKYSLLAPEDESQMTYDAKHIHTVPVDNRSSGESQRLNRLVLEKLDRTLRPLHTTGWRPTLFTYGLLGVIVGAVVWLVVRDTPRQHPWVTSQELDTIEAGVTPSPPVSYAIPWRALVTSGNQWLYCGMSFFSNYGWVFLITLVTRYLSERFATPVDRLGVYTTIPLFLAAFGMLAGGGVTDYLARRLGVRRGRAYPMGAMKWPCAALLALTPWLPEAWMVVAALSVMAVCQDFGIPAVWAFAQDTGGRQVGAVLGWGNMWGNFGAGVAPVVMGLIATNAGWDAALWSGAAAFAISGLCGVLTDASQPLQAG